MPGVEETAGSDLVVSTRESTSTKWVSLAVQGSQAAALGAQSRRAFVLQLYSSLDQLTPAERLESVIAFLDSGVDVQFGDVFAIGPGGYLRDWPTLRVALMDYLAQRDGTAARELAETILMSRPDEPGEWTLSLRELVRGRDPAQWPALADEKLRQFLLDPEWATASRRSWLEGFDIAVAGGAQRFLVDVGNVMARDDGSRGSRFAAFLAADRMMISEPGDTARLLNRESGLLSESPTVRAGLFARLDVREHAQLRELETYLRRNDVSMGEREHFGELFPFYDMAVSTNLLTQHRTLTVSEMIEQDNAAVRLVNGWLASGQHEDWNAALSRISERLGAQLRQADR